MRLLTSCLIWRCPMKSIRSYAPSLVLIVTLAVVLVGGPYAMRQFAWAEQDAKLEQARAQLHSKAAPLSGMSDAFKQVAKVAEPSVVHISIKRKIARRMVTPSAGPGAPGEPQTPEDLFRRFFERQNPGAPRGQAPQPDEQDDQYDEYNVPQTIGSGSGWVYQHNGENYIVTNNHVVEKADEITVKFFDKTTRDAEVVGTDPQTDIAVIKIKGAIQMHPAQLATKPVDQGELVFAFGSPFQFEFSMSQGIVSGKGREIGILRGVGGYENFIQTDAAINPGNSGGPLMNIYGEVVGMNSAIATRTGAFNGIGLAIPADMIRAVVTQIIDKGKVSRGYLGVFIGDLTPDMAKTFGYDGHGALVENITDGSSPAAKAGMKAGDIIYKVDGNDVEDASSLRRNVASIPPGQTITVNVFRDGKRIELKVKLEEKPDELAVRGGRPGIVPDKPADLDAEKLETFRKLGIERMQTVTKDLAARLEIDAEPGIVIESVRPGSVAATAGLQPGVIITQVQGEDVTTVTDLAQATAKLDLSKGVRFRVSYGGAKRFVVLTLPNE
ncbi:MAG: PDZ domain-containing protein [Phycisphaera sp.]|nr:PDZ domain-containing protein [Phycisphaera sp.]